MNVIITISIIYILQFFVAFVFQPKQEFKIEKGQYDKITLNVARFGMALSPLILFAKYFYLEFSEICSTICYYLGIIFFFSSLLVHISARLSLKDNFYPSAIIANNHMLITNGIYKIIRHPIYLSHILVWISVTLISLNWLYSIFVSLFVLRMMIRIPTEERLLIEKFGSEYVEYQKQAGCLLPKLNLYN